MADKNKRKVSDDGVVVLDIDRWLYMQIWELGLDGALPLVYDQGGYDAVVEFLHENGIDEKDGLHLPKS